MLKDHRAKLLAAYKDELEAASMYNRMAASAPTVELSQILSSMAADEYGHARTLASMLAMPMRIEAIPAPSGTGSYEQFRRDLETAIDGELAAIAEYAEFARTAPTLEMKLIFLSIAGDEYGHARTFITMLSLLSN